MLFLVQGFEPLFLVQRLVAVSSTIVEASISTVAVVRANAPTIVGARAGFGTELSASAFVGEAAECEEVNGGHWLSALLRARGQRGGA